MKSHLDSIALLGTSADPPTCGHEALLKGLVNIFPKVVTWASDNPTKQHSEPLQMRQQLLEALVADIDNPQLKIVQELSSPWTINTLEKANQYWPNANLFFVIGSDLTEQIPTWLQVKELLKKARIAIAVREGWPIKNSQLKEIKLLGGQVDLLPLTIPGSSSSSIRNKLVLSQIPHSILPLLLTHSLYGLTREKA